MRITVPHAGAVGLITDPYEQDVPPQGWSRVQNMRFDEQGARQVGGHTQVLNDGSATPITPTWIKFYPEKTNPRWLIADNNRVFCYQDFDFTNITRYISAPGDNNYSAVDRWQGTLFNNIAILNNGFDAPQMWSPIDDSTTLANLTNWPSGYRCRFIKPFKEFLIAGHIFNGSNTFPFRARWSHRAAAGTIPTSWDVTNPAVDAGEFDFGESVDHLVDGLDFGDQFIVYRENSTWVMRLTGTDAIFGRTRLSQSAGIIWKDCVLEIPKKGHIVATGDDLIIHQGTAGSFQSLLDGRTRREIAAALDTTNRRNCFLTINEPEKEVWFCFPETGFTYASRALLWNWVSGQVGHRTLESVPFADAGPILQEA